MTIPLVDLKSQFDLIKDEVHEAIQGLEIPGV